MSVEFEKIPDDVVKYVLITYLSGLSALNGIAKVNQRFYKIWNEIKNQFKWILIVRDNEDCYIGDGIKTQEVNDFHKLFAENMSYVWCNQLIIADNDYNVLKSLQKYKLRCVESLDKVTYCM